MSDTVRNDLLATLEKMRTMQWSRMRCAVEAARLLESILETE